MAGPSALVTGASRGIGLGIAEMLAARGYGLTIAARDRDRLEAVAARLQSLGAPEVRAVAGDLGGEDGPRRIARAHADTFGALRCLVLSAGTGTAGPIGEYPLHRLDRAVAVNLRAPFALVRECLPLLRDYPDGARVIALASLTGVYAESGLAAYGATKAALLSLIETLNAEESGNGVTATAIAPGYVDTDMSAWVAGRIPADAMIPVADIVRVAEALADLSPQSVISRIVMRRAGAPEYVALHRDSQQGRG